MIEANTLIRGHCISTRIQQIYNPMNPASQGGFVNEIISTIEFPCVYSTITVPGAKFRIDLIGKLDLGQEVELIVKIPQATPEDFPERIVMPIPNESNTP